LFGGDKLNSDFAKIIKDFENLTIIRKNNIIEYCLDEM
jgi:hypothetical protein